MTTRPQSVRRVQQRTTRQSSVLAIVAGVLFAAGMVAWLSNGVVVAIALALAGAIVSAAFIATRPTVRRANEQLSHVEEVRETQLRAAAAQRAAMERAFKQPVMADDDEPPTLRSPLPSSSGG